MTTIRTNDLSTLLLISILCLLFFGPGAYASSSSAVTLTTELGNSQLNRIYNEHNTTDSTKQPLTCAAKIANDIYQLENEKLFLKPNLVRTDLAVIGGSALLAIPTAAASLPAGLALLAGRNLGSDTVKQVSLSRQERSLALILEAQTLTHSKHGGESKLEVKNYPELRTLTKRINGPFTLFSEPELSLQEVAKLVVSANQDKQFCAQANNIKLVNFKDYILQNS